MSERTWIKSPVGFLGIFGIICGLLIFAQSASSRFAPQGAQREGQGRREGRQGGTGAPTVSIAPLFFKVEWVRPPSQTYQVPVVQGNIADTNLELKQYGPAAKKLLTSGAPGSSSTPFSVWSGECTGPFAITFKQKNNYVDLTHGQIRWMVKTSGFHVVRPVVKLADGTLLVGDHTSSSIPILAEDEFSLGGMRWLKLDPDRVVTLGGLRGPSEAYNETWVVNPDLSKVDEVGFADLMPASGHGPGGYIQVGLIEVYGNPAPRETTSGRN
jgi:hypothetical protein